MPYYHAIISLKERPEADALATDLSEKELIDKIIRPWSEGRKFVADDDLVDPDGIKSIRITKTVKSLVEIIGGSFVPTYAEYWEAASSGQDVTADYIAETEMRARGKGGKIGVFLSYSHEDRVLAGRIATILKGSGFEVFLAHEDMEVSKDWRDQIFEHLKVYSILVALLTPNFEKSVWTNQETGYMQGKNGKVIPLITKGTDIKRFGFLEALQGIPIDEDDLWEATEQLVKAILEKS